MNNTTLNAENKPQSYDQKLIIAGSIIEHYKYLRPVQLGSKEKIDFKLPLKLSQSDRDRLRRKSAHRAKKKLIQLINANCGQWCDTETGEVYPPTFLTLTFGENIQEVAYTNYEFKKFIQRLNYYVNSGKKHGLKYSTAPEFQKRGAVHYHTMLYNFPYIPVAEISKVWGHGFVKINVVKNTMNRGAYMCKYMAKEGGDERFIGEKKHFSSRGLLKPQETIDAYAISKYLSGVPSECEASKSSYHNEWCGWVEYTQYNLNLGVKRLQNMEGRC